MVIRAFGNYYGIITPIHFIVEAMIPDSIKDSNGSEMSFAQIDEAFSRSQYHESLAAISRFDLYMPEEVDGRQWEHWLGADVNGAKHLKVTYGLARAFLQKVEQDPAMPLSDDEKRMLQFASIVHDWGEAVVGDVNYDLKTESDEKKEVVELRKMLKVVLDARFDDQVIEEILGIVHFKKGRLGEMFNLIERVGYMRTGLNAWESRGYSPNRPLSNAFEWLSSNVAGNQVPKLLDYSKRFPPVALYLSNVRHQISDVFTNVPAGIFANFNTKAKQVKQENKFLAAKGDWEASDYAKNGSARDSGAAHRWPWFRRTWPNIGK